MRSGCKRSVARANSLAPCTASEARAESAPPPHPHTLTARARCTAAQAASDAPTSSHGGGDGGALREQNSELKEANAKLMSELNAFDLDFFEEIEDLKFRYHETKQENERLKAENRRLR